MGQIYTLENLKKIKSPPIFFLKKMKKWKNVVKK
jgi:hypothetical protein